MSSLGKTYTKIVSIALILSAIVITLKTLFAPPSTYESLALGVVDTDRIEVEKCKFSPEALSRIVGEKLIIINKDEKEHRMGFYDKVWKLSPGGDTEVLLDKPGSFGLSCDGGNEAFIFIY